MTPSRRVTTGVVSALLLVAFALGTHHPITPAWAQGVGIFSRASCTTTNLTGAVVGQTYCFDQSTRQLFSFNGTIFVPMTASVTGANFTAVGGQTNLGTYIVIASATGSGTQQIALGGQIQGQATGTATNRIAGYFGAQTSDTGTDTITGLNVVVQQGAAAFRVQIIGNELDINNNKADATLDMSPTMVGYSAVSGGSKIAGIAYAVGGAPQWMEGVQISQNAIATGGYAFRYKGDGVHGPFSVDYLSAATANTLNAASATYSNNIAVIVASGTTSNLTSIRGLSASSSKSNNLRGTCTFSASATCAVVFANNEPDANYFIGGIACSAAAAANVHPVSWDAKAVSGFTLRASVSNSNACDWMLLR